VAEEAEACDVGERVDGSARGQRLARPPVEGGHDAHRTVDETRLRHAALDGGGDDAGAERLGEQELVTGASTHVAQHLLRMDEPGDRQTVLGLGVVDAVAAQDGRARLGGGVGPAAQDLSQHLHRQLADREAHEVQREERPRAHRPDVGEGVGCGDAPEDERIVDHGREEVHRLDDGLGRGEPVHGRVVTRLVPDERARVLGARKAAQNLRQIRRADLAGSARAMGERGEPHLIGTGHACVLSAAGLRGKLVERRAGKLVERRTRVHSAPTRSPRSSSAASRCAASRSERGVASSTASSEP
jgi:hypothetical protein